MALARRIAGLGQGLGFFLVLAAFLSLQILIGGTRMVFSLPPMVLLGAAAFLAVFLPRKGLRAPNAFCLWVTIACFAYILLRAWFSPSPYITRSDICSVLGGLVVYFYTSSVLTSGRQRILFLGFLLALAIGHTLVGAVQFRDGTNYMPISWLQRYDYERRASGFYVCPNHLAGLLEVVGVLGLSVVCWSRIAAWAKLLIGYSVCVCYGGLILTGSRGGYLSAGVSLVVFAILSLLVLRKAGGRLFWAAGGIGLVAAILLGVAGVVAVKTSPFLTYRAKNTFELSNMRTQLWRSAIEQWKLSPLLGTGSATYRYYGRLLRDERMQRDPVYVHNDYLQLLAEYGLIGVGAMGLFVGAHLALGLRNFGRLGAKRVPLTQRITSNALALNIGALSAVASYLAHSVVDFNLHIPANVILLAFVFGLLANEGVLRAQDNSTPSTVPFLWRAVLLGFGLLLLVQCWRFLPGEYFSERARTSVRDQSGALGLLYASRGLKYDPLNPDLHYRLGQARRLLGDQMQVPEAKASFYEHAVRALDRAREIAPQEETYALELGSLLDVSKRFADAEQVYADALQLDPKSESLRAYYEGHLKLWRAAVGAEAGAKVEGEAPAEENRKSDGP